MVFQFSLGGFHSSHNYAVRLNGDSLSVSDSLYPMPPEEETKIPVTNNTSWPQLLHFLKSCRWHRTYESGILDGTQWELKAKGNGLHLKSYGSNAYPENFGEFIGLLNAVISSSGIAVHYQPIR